MDKYEIVPLLIARLKQGKGQFVYFNFFGEPEWFPIFAFLVKGRNRALLVDTGCTAEEAMRASARGTTFVNMCSLEDQLKEYGLNLDDVEDVIITHLHNDHYLNARKFPRATLWVQEDELAFAMNPHPFFSRFYDRARLEGLRFRTIKGDYLFAEGIQILHTPGHTPGTQSVEIVTEAGKVILAGFCSIKENFMPNVPIEFVPPGWHVDLLESYRSGLRLKERGGTIIPIHEPELEDKKRIP